MRNEQNTVAFDVWPNVAVLKPTNLFPDACLPEYPIVYVVCRQDRPRFEFLCPKPYLNNTGVRPRTPCSGTGAQRPTPGARRSAPGRNNWRRLAAWRRNRDNISRGRINSSAWGANGISTDEKLCRKRNTILICWQPS